MSNIEQYILSLSPQDRVSLIAFIANSLEVNNEGLELSMPKHIIEESKEIFKQWDEGSIKGISWKDLRKELKSNYLNA